MHSKQIHALRSQIHEAERSIPRNDRSQLAERERDLLITAASAVWDSNLKTLHSCFARLAQSPTDRKNSWNRLYHAFIASFCPLHR